MQKVSGINQKELAELFIPVLKTALRANGDGLFILLEPELVDDEVKTLIDKVLWKAVRVGFVVTITESMRHIPENVEWIELPFI